MYKIRRIKLPEVQLDGLAELGDERELQVEGGGRRVERTLMGCRDLNGGRGGSSGGG